MVRRRCRLVGLILAWGCDKVPHALRVGVGSTAEWLLLVVGAGDGWVRVG